MALGRLSIPEKNRPPASRADGLSPQYRLACSPGEDGLESYLVRMALYSLIELLALKVGVLHPGNLLMK